MEGIWADIGMQAHKQDYSAQEFGSKQAKIKSTFWMCGALVAYLFKGSRP